MADTEDAFFAIEVDGSDDCLETAAGDTATVPRTYQSEEAFQDQKAKYAAKVDRGTRLDELIAALPALGKASSSEQNPLASTSLSKLQIRLLASALAELYYDAEYTRAISLCHQVRNTFSLDKRTRDDIERCVVRCSTRLRSPS